jgi:hypothetical protein
MKFLQNYSTQYSRVVPHHSTDWAITSLTSQIGRDAVLSSVYGRSYPQNSTIVFISKFRVCSNNYLFPRLKIQTLNSCQNAEVTWQESVLISKSKPIE